MDWDVETVNDNVDILGSFLDQGIVMVLERSSKLGADPSLKDKQRQFAEENFPCKQQEVVSHDFFGAGKLIKTCNTV
jgi:hypothetical protein